jgi:hypothetical protein
MINAIIKVEEAESYFYDFLAINRLMVKLKL